MAVTEREGVIKFTLDHELADASLIRAFSGFEALNPCRSTLWQLGVLGQDDSRYEGLGYGNASIRTPSPDYPNAFLITGTQTGYLSQLSAEHYSLVMDFDLQQYYLRSKGPCKPSSEAMTHAALYQRLPDVVAVIHGHSPAVWNSAHRLGLACTAADVPYGTPQMAQAIQDLLGDGEPPGSTIVMLGHEDGFITWGNSLENTLEKVNSLLEDAS
ncbi:class II aldolase/adducin family protein [Thiothrix nivea]|uniref:Class II aldolase/adducin family protein n=1 Tax=Thiothrix nivea (strain ATCC 35100 / DSM 5205 / JP2) TaxID=870187 RepID=A0A656HNE6_THINJ|nr:class II aldolase/adducin family protein [Thiothrix nivea]EIJ36870.1 class II aldolase/adducin family protein [Thiothrix nivea DSM 5205]